MVVRVLPDVPAIQKTFDYLVPDPLRDQVRVGDMVRIDLHGRRVGGWVVAVGVDAPVGVRLRPLARRSGLGPTPDLLELARWAAWRWAGRPATFLRTASPDRMVAALPAGTRASGHRPPRRAAVPGEAPTSVHARADAALDLGRAVLRLPPAAGLGPVAAAAAARGPSLVVCPTQEGARRVTAHLREAGLAVAAHPDGWARGAAGATVVGTRSAAWAPVRGLAAVVVLDEHDERLQEERAPTWHARDVAVERAARAGVPCLLTSPCPSLEALAWGRLVTLDRAGERAGWPPVDVIDRRAEDPRTAGPFSPALVRVLRSDRRILCVLNRTGRARLLACRACGELARCERCDAAVEQPDDDLSCRRCGTTRPAVCARCGATSLRLVRRGVRRLREELEALVGEPVGEVVAGPKAACVEPTRVMVGTEAVLQRVPTADVVAFLDIDQELLAPRYRAAEQALGLLVMGARTVTRSGATGGGGRAPGRLLVQTRVPGHEVLRAVLLADPGRVATVEDDRRRVLRFPPHAALAAVSGAGAGDYVSGVPRVLGLEVAETEPGRWLLRAPDHATLCDALAGTPRPGGRLRVEVDPLRV